MSEYKILTINPGSTSIPKGGSVGSYLVLEGGMVQIFDMKFDREKYSALAGENGIGILAKNMKQNSLEDYYMNLTKGGQLV